VKRVKTLLTRVRMSIDAALGLATSYAERKQIPVVYADSLPRECQSAKVALRFQLAQLSSIGAVSCSKFF
jgi:hypothetical protein